MRIVSPMFEPPKKQKATPQEKFDVVFLVVVLIVSMVVAAVVTETTGGLGGFVAFLACWLILWGGYARARGIQP